MATHGVDRGPVRFLLPIYLTKGVNHINFEASK